MNREIVLPAPTEEELKPYNKVNYFMRLLHETDLPKQLNMSLSIVADWMSDNYDSIYLYNKPLKFKR
jgi:hypothetical protein